MLRVLSQSLKSCVNAVRSAAGSNVPPAGALPTTQGVQTRTVSTSSVVSVKYIEKVTEDNVTKIEGKIVESERAGKVVQLNSEGCTLCNVRPFLKYTDVLILSQFLRADGCLLPRRATGVCFSQQKRLAVLVNKAQRAGLLPQFRPGLKSGKPRTNHRSNYKWKRFNVYFKE